MRVYMENYGCPMNKADGQYMLDILIKQGFKIVGQPEVADIIIINTCTVRKDTEEHMINRIMKLYKIALEEKAKLIVTGCMPKAQPYLIAKIAPNANMVSPQNIDKIFEAVTADKRKILIKGERDVNTVPMYMSNVVAVIPIAEGCVGNCSYCIVKLARGKLKSYPPRLIVKKVLEALEKGAVEIDLTAQDTAAYGLDIGIRLPNLLHHIIGLKGNFMIRVGMMNPNLVLQMIDELIDIYKHPKVFKFLHIPLQSGDDRVLKLMNRPYSVDEFKYIVYEFRKKIPEINVTTDIIVGHPGEDDEAFENTLKLIKELEFDRIHIAAYSLRPHTKSASLPQIPGKIKKQRLKRIMRIMEEVAFKKHLKLKNKVVTGLITEIGKNYTVIARTLNYYPIVLKETREKLGKWALIYIEENTFYDLRGTIVKYVNKTIRV